LKPDGAAIREAFRWEDSGAVKNPVDSAGFYTGASDDFYMHHNGTDSWLESVTGILKINTSQTAGISLLYNGTENMVTAAGNGAVTLYHDNSTRAATTAAGMAWTSAVDTGAWDFANGYGGVGVGGMSIRFTAAARDNNTESFFYVSDSSTTRAVLYSDGDWYNSDGTYGTISDENIKQDITDMRSYWDDFSLLQFRKYRHIEQVERDGDEAPFRVGMVAQEVEVVFPGLVANTRDPSSGDEIKAIRSSIIEGPIMGRVMQEAQARIETLEAQVAALQN